MKNNISAKLSTKSLTFKPNKPPVSFEVSVNNDSDRFANFQLEIEAAGEKGDSDYRWYRLEPEIAAAQPHGSTTHFQVFIFDTPIPGFVGTINLIIKVFSPQLGEERRLSLRLQIERDQKPNLLSIELPVRDYQVYPGNTVDIKIKLRNMGQQPANITLNFAGIDPSWLVGSQQRRLSINAGSYKELAFPCQPPSVAQAPSDIYPFKIEATSHNSFPASGEGNLEVLPVGFIKFNTPQNRKTLPKGKTWLRLPDWKSKTVNYELLFKNASNLSQEISLQVQGRDSRKCIFKKQPETINLELAKTAKIDLGVTTKPPWLGIGKTLLLEARPELYDQRLGSTDPATQTLELKVLPIIPLWLQLLLALLALLLALLWPKEIPHHLSAVNSVQIYGSGELAVSGSDDCTLRLWKIDNRKLEPKTIALESAKKYEEICNKRHRTKGLFAKDKSGVNVVRLVPPNEKIVAVGLDNGTIKFINSLAPKNRPKFQDLDAVDDKVFDLTFTSTSDSIHLFAGYGSGKLRIWSREKANGSWQKKPKVLDLRSRLEKKLGLSSFEIYALDVSRDGKYLIVAGRFRLFFKLPVDKLLSNNSLEDFTDFSLQKLTNKNIGGASGQKTRITGLDFAASGNSRYKNILATSDTEGYIAIWNLDECKLLDNSEQKYYQDVDCKYLEKWEVKPFTPINSLKFSEDRKYLVSGGDNGRVLVWYLKSNFELDRSKSDFPKGKTIKPISKEQINSIDLKSHEDTGKGFVISGSQDHQVRLHKID
ncbi:hypothetical protein [Rivularia sp. UHCC 0363]|uniref:hypothetical protein n=1 Tax=Rivularia sp. UHCC 0363 TaxID=3110244 RepID=UPI002B1F9C24|nr:hypothetical protein [Rivularia sp. UHCC 0363]MEA5598413.1 hypothetical protein [Rivularia sp. UHCC 0363]